MITEADLLAIYRDTVRELYAYVSRRTGGDRELAKDTVQEAYLRALDHWCRRGAPTVPLAWLKTTSRNLLASHFRRVRPASLEAAGIDVEDEGWSPADADEAAVLQGGLARLGEDQARLLESFYFEQKSTRVIAAEEGLSERAVEGRLRRARQKLAGHLRRLRTERGGSR